MDSALVGLLPHDSRTKRLSKPRTNTSSSNLLALREQQANATPSIASESSKSNDEQRLPRQNAEKCKSRRKSMVRIASYFKKSPTEDDDVLDCESPNILATEDSPTLKKRFSIGATSSHVPSTRPSTSNLFSISSGSINDEDSLRLFDEMRIKEKALADVKAALNHVAPPADEDKHPDSLNSPIRRKSLYTPGIATRTPHDILRKPPPPTQLETEADRAYYYNPMYSDRSPLARLASLELSQNGRSTPCDLDRTHLGGLSLGTLRVMNGAASPEPQCESPNSRPLSSSRSDDDYFTASESLRSDHENTAPMPIMSCQNDRRVATRRSGSPLKHERQAPYMEAESTNRGPQETSLPRVSPAFSRWEHDYVQKDSASAMAQDYMSELPDSPFKPFTNFDVPPPKADQNYNGFMKQQPHDILDTMYLTLHQDITPYTMNARASQVSLLCHDACDRLYTGDNKELESTLQPPSTSTAISRNTDSAVSNTQSMAGSFGDKADSGYVSDVSGTTFIGPTGAFDRDIEAKFFPGPLPNQDQGGNSEQRQQDIAQTRPTLQDRASTAPQMPLSPRYLKPCTMTENASPGEAQDRAQVRSSSSSWRLSLPVWTGSCKLQKARRSSQPPPTEGQLSRELSQSHLPLVPPDLATRMSERSLQFPLLERTFISTNIAPRASSPNWQSLVAPLRFPSAASQGEERTETDERIDAICRSDLDWPSKKSKKKKEDAKKKKEAAAGEKVNKRATLSKAKRRASEIETVATIADFGTVTESLGKSPYDIAMDIVHPQARNQSPARTLQPYRMSTSMPRAKQTIGMSDEEAAEFARAANERYRRRSSNFGKPDGLISAKADDTTPTPNRGPRPRSMYADVPPMPVLPSHTTSDGRGCHDSADGDLPRPRTTQQLSHKSQHAFDGLNASSSLDLPRTTGEFPKRSAGRVKTLTARPRPCSMYANIPPVPAPPAHERGGDRIDVRIDDGSLLSARRLRPEADGGRRDIRSSAPLAVKPLPQESIEDSIWAASSTAWSQRRKSAGEALLKQQVNAPREQHCDTAQDEPLIASLHHQGERPRSVHSSKQDQRIIDIKEQHAEDQQHLRAWSHDHPDHKIDQHLAQGPNVKYPSSHDHQQQQAPGISTLKIANSQRQDSFSHPEAKSATPSFHIPRKRVVPHVTAFEALFSHPPIASTPPPPPPKDNDESLYPATGRFTGLSGRYEGGLMYGYEPGFGLGGSAGTRIPKTGATRKSVGVASTFGVDLSDVPVFVGKA